MVHLIIAAHGKLALELVNSAQMVYGETDNVHPVIFVPGEGQDTLVEKYEAIIATLQPEDCVLFLVDLFGGSPYNAAARIVAKRPQDDIVTGTNLPMLLEVMDASADAKTASELAATAKEVGNLSVRTYHNPEPAVPVSQPETTSEESPSLPTNYDPNGRMNISLMRIDSRLIHGQVMTSWTKTVKCEAIFAISDEVANDDIRRELLLQIVPEHLKGYVITVDKAIKVWHNPKYAGKNIIWLVTNPSDIVRLIEGGVNIKNVNVGGMTFREGDKLISQAVAINQTDLAAFYKLLELGVDMSLQQVAANKKEPLDKARLDAIKF
ncbi:mannose/fructose/sorbose PTS transporter subunit IIB [Actinobacillus pleuropneumoniae]|uniref:PTS system mannose-specific EIIAB component n=1 Tax=Actinobacillus pleuropneumoniae serotype 3 (strain JL03) TaxID=434271 RepID=B0BS90_ACTPJ|nr:mannose/fructose/sorbose PTS transporter subunit IIB [Actinobacillus pleuropneumoniae]ABY70247.1 phosphotransferase system,mannose/fructose/N-acetylgalactosamine-specific component IIB [Actinobacillus pleuropneumoniae serovar 3 str. JL03]EFM99953.1 PTS system, mannose/fructose/sorbose family, IIA subunit [Actinobacillus pleuropneumoniae serovar 12 str. 1096]UKH15165.1 PTS mannose transporter subunit IIAB [Actinobacillus pleuropneumoniae]UKH23337.1 PTS mannose transporter subunit IIAB [Actino